MGDVADDGQVDAACEQGVGGLVDAVDLDAPAAVLEAGTHRSEPVGGQQPGEPDPHPRRGAELVAQVVELGEDPATARQQQLATGRQLEPPGMADHQIAVEDAFQLLDRPAQRRLADVQACRRANERTLLAEGDERGEMPHLKIHTLRLYMMTNGYFSALPAGPTVMRMTTTETRAGARSTSIAAAAGLAAAMGVGRFVYTPLLPIMTTSAGITARDGALIATGNYLGYLVGAVLLARMPHLSRRSTFLLWSVALVASEVAMATTTHVPTLAVLRFVAGTASAGIFVACVSTVARHRHASPGIAFGGVGAGITLTGLFTLVAAPHLTWQQMWIGSAALTAVLVAPACRLDIRAESAPAADQQEPRGPRLAWRLLLASYFAEGLGYIVVGTFLAAAVGGASTGAAVWTLVGLSAAPATVLWQGLAQRTGIGRALVSALILQAIGAALPALSDIVAASLVAAILFGATFIGITMLTMSLGSQMSTHRSAATLTAVYAVGQVAGPLVVAPVLGDSYRTAFTVAALVITASAVLAVAAIRAHRPAGSGERAGCGPLAP